MTKEGMDKEISLLWKMATFLHIVILVLIGTVTILVVEVFFGN